MIKDGRELSDVTPDELSFALAVGGAAASGRTPQSGVGGYGIDLETGDGVRSLAFTDIPENRAMFAIRDQFPRDRFQPIMFRLWALQGMIADSRMEAWRRQPNDDPDMVEIHQAVIDVAAVMPLNRDGHFNAQKFFRRVAARAREIEAEGQDATAA